MHGVVVALTSALSCPAPAVQALGVKKDVFSMVFGESTRFEPASFNLPLRIRPFKLTMTTSKD